MLGTHSLLLPRLGNHRKQLPKCLNRIMALAPIRLWRDVRLGPHAHLAPWTSGSEDPWRDREWLRSGWGSAVLLAWKMVTLDSRLSCAVHNAEAAAKKLRHTHYLEAYVEVDAKRRRLASQHRHRTECLLRVQVRPSDHQGLIPLISAQSQSTRLWAHRDHNCVASLANKIELDCATSVTLAK